jgi:hypothetical protein
MATGTSVVGSWQNYVHWNNLFVMKGEIFTFKADGTWTYTFGGGRWIQIEGMMFLNFDSTPKLVYAGNVTPDTIAGIMGILSANGSQGTFYMIRQGSQPAALQASSPTTAKAAPKLDIQISPPQRGQVDQ